jgi:hypothetical protein
MSDVNLQKPALPGAGKSQRFFDKSDLTVFAMVGALVVVIGGFSENPTVEDWLGKQWAGKCAAYDGHLGTVSEIEVGGAYATVSRLDGSQRERIALAKLTRVECPVAGHPSEVAKTPASVVPGEVDGLAERHKEIMHLKLDLEIATLQLDLARVKIAYHQALYGSGSEGANAFGGHTSGAEIGDNPRRIDRLRMEIERARTARDYYNRLNGSPGPDTTR